LWRSRRAQTQGCSHALAAGAFRRQLPFRERSAPRDRTRRRERDRQPHRALGRRKGRALSTTSLARLHYHYAGKRRAREQAMSKSDASAMLRRIAAVMLLLAFVAGCDKPPDLLAMPKTDLTMVELAVRNRIAAATAEFETSIKSDPSSAARARAYGELAMVYHAQDLTAPARVAYINAHRLDPRDKRWPYLLAHLYADQGNIPEAIKYFELVRTVDRSYVPA